MNKLKRRQLLQSLSGALGGLLVVSQTSVMTGCAAPTPAPFLTGEVVTAPIGCTELLARDPRGDC